MLTPDDIKKASALAARHAAERTELAAKQANERESMIDRQRKEAEATGIGAPPPTAAPIKKAKKP